MNLLMIKTKVPPPVIMFLIAIMMWFLDKYLPIYIWLGSPWNKLGLLFIGVSLLLDSWSLFLFIKAKTTFNPMQLAKTSHLVTNGVYRISRNPMYLGLLVMLNGWALCLGSVSPLLLIPFFVWLVTKLQIEPEEAILIEKFGSPYREYLLRVRRWL